MARVRTIANLLLLAACSLLLFIVGVLATFKINVLIYGVEEFNGNAGPGFAVLLEGVLIGVILAVCGVPLAIFLAKRIPWLRDEWEPLQKTPE